MAVDDRAGILYLTTVTTGTPVDNPARRSVEEAVLAIDLNADRVLWGAKAPLMFDPVVDPVNKRLYGCDRRVRAVRVMAAEDGSFLRTIPVGPEFAVRNTPSGSHVVVVGLAGSSQAMASDTAGRRMYFPSHTSDGVDVFDWASDRVIRTIPFGSPISAISVEPGSRRVLIASSDGTVKLVPVERRSATHRDQTPMPERDETPLSSISGSARGPGDKSKPRGAQKLI